MAVGVSNYATGYSIAQQRFHVLKTSYVIWEQILLIKKKGVVSCYSGEHRYNINYEPKVIFFNKKLRRELWKE